MTNKKRIRAIETYSETKMRTALPRKLSPVPHAKFTNPLERRNETYLRLDRGQLEWYLKPASFLSPMNLNMSDPPLKFGISSLAPTGKKRSPCDDCILATLYLLIPTSLLNLFYHTAQPWQPWVPELHIFEYPVSNLETFCVPSFRRNTIQEVCSDIL